MKLQNLLFFGLLILLLNLPKGVLGQSKVTFNFNTSLLTIDNSTSKKKSAQGVTQFAIVPIKGFVDLFINNIDLTKYEVKVNKKAINFTYPEEEKVQKNARGASNTVYSRINYIDSDEMIVTIEITDKTSKIALPEIQFTIRTHGRLKLDVSTGAIFNIGLTDESYEIQDNTIVDPDDKSEVTPIFPTVLTHAYAKSYKNFNIGASFGLGISDGDNFNFYLGPAFIFGENQRFIFSGGIGLSKVTKLKSQYSEGQSFTENTPDVSELTTDPYKFGGFFALTYNLTSKKD